jgi:hypothetical protein
VYVSTLLTSRPASTRKCWLQKILIYIYIDMNSLDNSWMKDCCINTVQGTTVLSSLIYPRFELCFSFCTKEQTNTHRFVYLPSGNIYRVGHIRQTSGNLFSNYIYVPKAQHTTLISHGCNRKRQCLVYNSLNYLTW